MKIAVIGTGYVGTAVYDFFCSFADMVSFDIAKDKIYPQKEIDSADIVIVCVSTPMSNNGSCNISNVEDAISKINNKHILIKSTVSPGTTKYLSEKYKKNICFSPEYIGESTYNNNIYKTMKDIPFVIIGGIHSEVEYLFKIFEQILGPESTYFECDSLDAELIKYMENSFLATKVTFVNDYYEIVKQFGANWYKVREGWLLDKRIGRPFTSVFANKRGFSGKCLPKDINAISFASKKSGYRSNFLDQVIKTNQAIQIKYSEPDVKTSFEFNNKKFAVLWYDINDDKVPDLPWQQVYAIGNVDGKVPIVHYSNNDPDNLPGGKLEENESVDGALRRELIEEICAHVKSWHPIGYQIIIGPDNIPKYQLRVYAELLILKKFTSDPGGLVCGNSLVKINELNKYINYGIIGERISNRVSEMFNK